MNEQNETVKLLEECKQKGFNMYPLIGLYRKRSKLAPKIPETVIKEVCLEYLRNKPVRADFPYFLAVLKNKTRNYFAQENVRESQALKREPTRLGDIMRRIASQ